MHNKVIEIKHCLVVDKVERLDVFLAASLGMSRNKIGKLIEENECLVNSKQVKKSSHKLSIGDSVVFSFSEEPKPTELLAQDIPIQILWENNDMLAVDKPAGMVVHPAAGNEDGTLVNALLHHVKDLSGINGAQRPGIVHRLDKDTSGLLLVAKNDNAHLYLSEQIQNRSIKKYYIALVHGTMKETTGSIIKPIARHRVDRKKMAVVEGGKYAESRWQVLDSRNNTSLLLVRIITGRTHQIRVHLASISRPVVGDAIYNTQSKQKNTRLMLHAYRVEFAIKEELRDKVIRANLPGDFLENLSHFSYKKEEIISLLENINILI